MHDNEFYIMKEIGEEVGASSHRIGKWFVELEYRDAAKEPTHKAWHAGMCRQRRDPESGHFQIVWHKQKTIKAFEDAGFIPARQEVATVAAREVKMLGPFEIRTTDGGVEIANSQGNVVCASYSPDCGAQIVKLLNIVYDIGKFRE